MKKSDVIAWKTGFEAAREAERQLTRHEVLDPERSIQLALALIATCRQSGAWLGQEKDPLREKEVAQVRVWWKRLKKARLKSEQR